MTEVMDAFLKEIELREAHKPTTEKPENYERRKNNIYGHAGGSAAALFTRQGHGNYGRIKCAYCLGEHSHENCKKITDINERKQLIRKYGRCFICLKKGHISKIVLVMLIVMHAGNDNIGLFVRVLGFLLTMFNPIIPFWVLKVG
jgi:hypothetical protein